MILNLHSLAFNTLTSSGGGNPAWGTEMGQGEGYRFNFEKSDEFMAALVYNSVNNPQSRVKCPLGKGGNQAGDYEFVLASLFNKVYVNGKHVNGKFLLLVVKKLVGENHVGRRTLKYSPKITLDNINYNEPCFNEMGKALGVSSQGSWFVSQINVRNQDELHFTAHVLDENNKTVFTDSADRSKKLQEKLEAYAKENPESHLATYPKKNKFPTEPRQIIFYGAPGTGKSHTIEQKTNPKTTIRITFHPDSDYSTFVGAYKPTVCNHRMSYISEGLAKFAKSTADHDGTEQKILYSFVPQAFLKAYTDAWLNLDEPHFLVIEEINRGNCAQIFGDLFQLLDRRDDGFSSYPIQPDADICKYLTKRFAQNDDEENWKTEEIRSIRITRENGDEIVNGNDILLGEKMVLPPNLFIWATMNTSDQSLFPIDSAFKRRWDWKYMPIEYRPTNRKTGKPIDWKFKIGDNLYSWGQFLNKINPEIYSLTESSDKQMGYFFAKADYSTGIISEEVFLNKILFYLWTDVFKDFDVSSDLFKNIKENRPFRFTDFFDVKQPQALSDFIANFKLDVIDIDIDSINDEDSDVDETVEGNSSQRDHSKYSINGEGKYNKRQTVLRSLRRYVESNPTMTSAEIIEKWKTVNPDITYFILSAQEYENRINEYPAQRDRYWSVKTGNDEKVYITNQWNAGRIAGFIDLINNSDFGLHIEKIAE